VSTSQETAIAPALAVADPAPLGLAAFALTTFLLSAANAGWTKGAANEWIGYAFAYGGLGQLLAGMWEFKNKNVFGATAFSTYGAFWIGLGLYFLLGPGAADPKSNVLNDLGWILLAFAIFNTYMLIWSSQVSMAVFTVFLTLELTEILLFIGFFGGNGAGMGATKIGGIVGIVTAAAAWYASAAGVINGMKGRTVVPVGKPLFNL
jgi:uncharacterized protein